MNPQTRSLKWRAGVGYLSQLGAQSHFESLHSNLHGQHVVITGGPSGSMRHPTWEKTRPEEEKRVDDAAEKRSRWMKAKHWKQSPPRHIGDLMLPWRARPLPFCFHGFLPPPRTSDLTFVWAWLWHIKQRAVSLAGQYQTQIISAWVYFIDWALV